MKICVVCGKEFETGKTRSNSAKGCSVECSKLNKRRVRKEYLEKNKETMIKKRKEYYEKNRDVILLRWRIYRRENPDKVKESSRKSRMKYREQRIAYSKRKDKEKRLEVLIHYGGDPPKCACCGELHIEFLTIDHIHGGGTKHIKKLGIGGKLHRWLAKNNFPSGYQILCMNCNFSLGCHGYCPHKNKPKNC